MTATSRDLPDSCAALVCTAPRRAEIRRVAVPRALGDGGMGRVLAAGVCGSDLSLFRGGPIAERLWPLVLGHETVVRVDASSHVLAERWGVGVGDRVFVEEFIPCGWCQTCRSGNYRVCPRTDFRSERFVRYGRTSLDSGPGLWGGFAEYLYLHPDARLHPVPDSVESQVAALATPIANGLRWVRTVADTQPADNVVVLGPGAHGLGCVAAARQVGAHEVIVIGRSSDGQRLDVATALGATAALRIDHDDVLAEVHRRTAGRGADVVVDATGSAEAASLAPRFAARSGRVVLAGGTTGPADDFPVDLVTSRELSILGVRGHDGYDIARALRLIEAKTADFSLMSAPATVLSEGAALLTDLCADDATGHAPHHVLVPGPEPADADRDVEE
ncbi:MAG: zinc-binding dehydrogenase [Propionibacteriales bacterium]|nr:zinc-binding dehydrogenase [Propionibacteriales bacterium]